MDLGIGTMFGSMFGYGSGDSDESDQKKQQKQKGDDEPAGLARSTGAKPKKGKGAKGKGAKGKRAKGSGLSEPSEPSELQQKLQRRRQIQQGKEKAPTAGLDERVTGRVARSKKQKRQEIQEGERARWDKVGYTPAEAMGTGRPMDPIEHRHAGVDHPGLMKESVRRALVKEQERQRERDARNAEERAMMSSLARGQMGSGYGRAPSEWDQFRQQYGGMGYTQKQLSKMYRKQQQGGGGYGRARRHY